MAIHHLHLHPGPFELIRSGQKTVESRLFDEKRQTYRIGDTLVFANRGNELELIKTQIISLHRFNSFRELFLSSKTRGKFSTNSFDELIAGIELYYSAEDQEKYGVVGIEFVIKNTK